MGNIYPASEGVIKFLAVEGMINFLAARGVRVSRFDE